MKNEKQKKRLVRISCLLLLLIVNAMNPILAQGNEDNLFQIYQMSTNQVYPFESGGTQVWEPFSGEDFVVLRDTPGGDYGDGDSLGNETPVDIDLSVALILVVNSILYVYWQRNRNKKRV